MISAVLPGAGRRRSARWWVVAAVLLLVAAGCLVVSLRGQRDPAGVPAAFPLASASATAGPTEAPGTSRRAGATGGTAAQPAAGTSRPPRATGSTPAPAGAPGPARSAPVALRIPAIGLAVSLSGLGLNADGTVQVPTDFQQPGWFRLGPSPGQVGSAVILGHVDSYRGPAVFFRLRSLEAGDRVEVSLADGAVAHFVVRAVETYLKREFPARRVYASRGYSALQLVTCGGEFDRRARSYLSNVVAYTTLVATAPAASPATPR